MSRVMMNKPLLMLAAGVLAASVAHTAAAKGDARATSWYLQTKVLVEDGDELFYDDRGGVIGRIPGARNLKDVHDIPAFSSLAGAPAAVVIVKDERFSQQAGEYLSDYRKPGTSRQVWDFTVTSNQPDATVTVFWDGFYTITANRDGGFTTEEANDNRVFRSLRLIDLELGKEVTRAVNGKGRLLSYTFKLNGATQRQFRWVTGKVKREDLVLSGAPVLNEVATFNAGPQGVQAQSGAATQATNGFGGPPAVDSVSDFEVPASSRPSERLK